MYKKWKRTFVYSAANDRSPPIVQGGMNGPEPTFASGLSAVAQLHESGHSTIAPHFLTAKVGSAGHSCQRLTVGIMEAV